MKFLDGIFGGGQKKKKLKDMSLLEAWAEGFITEEEYLRLRYFRADNELDDFLKKEKKKKTAKAF